MRWTADDLIVQHFAIARATQRQLQPAAFSDSFLNARLFQAERLGLELEARSVFQQSAVGLVAQTRRIEPTERYFWRLS